MAYVVENKGTHETRIVTGNTAFEARSAELQERTPQRKAKEYMDKYGLVSAAKTARDNASKHIKGSPTFKFWMDVVDIVREADRTPYFNPGPSEQSKANRKKAIRDKAIKRKSLVRA